MKLYSLSATGDVIIIIAFAFVVLVSLLLVYALIRVIGNFVRQLRDSAAAGLLDAFRQDVESGEFARRLQEPKSLSGMDSIYGPQISRDFPELNIEELKHRAENLVITTLAAISSGDFAVLSEKSELYNHRLTSYLAGLQSVGETESLTQPAVHRIVISDYRKDAGTCRIGFELAVSALYERRDPAGRIIGGGSGRSQLKCQVQALYIQDQARVSQPEMQAMAFNCPNCGAPVGSIGTRQCQYCGSAVEPLNSRVWTFSDFSLSI